MSPSTNSLTMATGTVLLLVEDRNVSAYRNSFQHNVKQKMKAEIRPGTESGNTISR